jgi:serine/threonine-protein phosphatase 2B catalytic subunit
MEINRVNRFMEVPETGSLCDFLWSDPTENPSGQMANYYEYNDSRGCAYYFGLESTKNFLESNKLLTVIR